MFVVFKHKSFILLFLLCALFEHEAQIVRISCRSSLIIEKLIHIVPIQLAFSKRRKKCLFGKVYSSDNAVLSDDEEKKHEFELETDCEMLNLSMSDDINDRGREHL